MKIQIQNLKDKKIYLPMFGNIMLLPEEIVEIEVNENNLIEIQNTSFLKIIQERSIEKKKKKEVE